MIARKRERWKAFVPLVAMIIFWLCVGGRAWYGLKTVWLATEQTKRAHLLPDVFKALLTVLQAAIVGSAAALLLELFKQRQAAAVSDAERQRRALQDSRHAYDEIKTVRRLLQATQVYSPLKRNADGKKEERPSATARWVQDHHPLLEEMGRRLMKAQLLLEFLKDQYPKPPFQPALRDMEKEINHVSKVMLQADVRKGNLDDDELAVLNGFLGDDFATVADRYHEVVTQLSA